MTDDEQPGTGGSPALPDKFSKTVIEAVDWLEAVLADDGLAQIAAMAEDDLATSDSGLGTYIRNSLDLWQNEALMAGPRLGGRSGRDRGRQRHGRLAWDARATLRRRQQEALFRVWGQCRSCPRLAPGGGAGYGPPALRPPRSTTRRTGPETDSHETRHSSRDFLTHACIYAA